MPPLSLSMKGIYAYVDTMDNSVVYVGKDSHIGENKRHKQHYQSSNYNEQTINRVLQNNKGRYDYKCLCCGNDNEKELQVHHIRAFKDNLELATSVKNGATLCKDCHTKYHKKYGWKGKQETFSRFIKEMLD